jgi:hypothetical protein
MNSVSFCSNEDSITVTLKSIVNTNSILKDALQTGGLVSKCFVRYSCLVTCFLKFSIPCPLCMGLCSYFVLLGSSLQIGLSLCSFF